MNGIRFFARRPLYAAVVAVCLLGQAACSSLVHVPLSPRHAPDSAETVLLENVPFVAQEDYQCGPAALEMVLAYIDRSPGHANLVDWVYSPARQGSLQPFMVGGVRRAGGVAYEIRGVPALLTEVAAGHPVVVLQNLGLNWLPRWHYAVVIGYDLKRSKLVMHSGTTEHISVDWSRFVSTWKRGGEWGLLALPHGILPRTVTPEQAFLAVAATEPTGVEAAHLILSYQAILSRWPTHLAAGLALANVYYQSGQISQAGEILRQVVEHYPESAAAHNNLAALYLEEGQLKEARHHALIAVALGGEYLSFARQTLADIEAQQQAQPATQQEAQPADRHGD